MTLDDQLDYLEPIVRVLEKEDHFIVYVDLPLVKKEDVKVFVTNRGMEIEAKMFRSFTFERWGTIQKERSYNSYRRFMSLPSEIDPESVTALFKKGLLIVTLAKTIDKKRIDIL